MASYRLKRAFFRLLPGLLLFWSAYSCKKSTQASAPSDQNTYFKVFNYNLNPGWSSGSVYSLFGDKVGNAYLIGADTDFYLMKFDKMGIFQSKKEFGTGSAYDNVFYATLFDGASFYVFRSSYGSSTDSCFLNKVDLNGNMVINAPLTTQGTAYFFMPGPNFSGQFPSNFTMTASGNIALLTKSIDTENNSGLHRNIPALSIFSNTGMFLNTTYLDTISVPADASNFYLWPIYLYATSTGGYFILYQITVSATEELENFYYVNNMGVCLAKRSFSDTALNLPSGFSTTPNTNIFEKNQNAFDVLFEGVAVGGNGYTVLDTELNIVQQGKLSFTLQNFNVMQMSGGRLLALATDDGSNNINIHATTSSILDIGADLSVQSTKVISEKGGSVFLKLMAQTPANQHLFFGLIQSFGPQGDSSFSNVLIKTNSNETY